MVAAVSGPSSDHNAAEACCFDGGSQLRWGRDRAAQGQGQGGHHHAHACAHARVHVLTTGVRWRALGADRRGPGTGARRLMVRVWGRNQGAVVGLWASGRWRTHPCRAHGALVRTCEYPRSARAGNAMQENVGCWPGSYACVCAACTVDGSRCPLSALWWVQAVCSDAQSSHHWHTCTVCLALAVLCYSCMQLHVGSSQQGY